MELGKYVWVSYGYIVGIDEECFSDFYMMFCWIDIDVIWCVCGGYGCICLLLDFDYEFI